MSKVEELQKEELMSRHACFKSYVEEYENQASLTEGKMHGRKFRQLTDVENRLNIQHYLNRNH